MADNEDAVVEWSFFGRVVPERVTLIVDLPEVGMSLDAADVKLSVTLHIHQCQIVATIKVFGGDPDVLTLRNAVEGYCRDVVDIIGFQSGMSFDVDIISCTSSRGGWNIFASEIPVLFSKKGGGPTSISSDVLNAVFSQPHASIALADFREAMRVPLQTGFFCYRAVEAMMQSMKASPNAKDGPAWFKLRQTLRLEEEAILFIKGHADWARHGKIGNISDADRAQIFEITDEVIARYLKYLEGGETPLGPEVGMLAAPT